MLRASRCVATRVCKSNMPKRTKRDSEQNEHQTSPIWVPVLLVWALSTTHTLVLRYAHSARYQCRGPRLSGVCTDGRAPRAIESTMHAKALGPLCQTFTTDQVALLANCVSSPSHDRSLDPRGAAWRRLESYIPPSRMHSPHKRPELLVCKISSLHHVVQRTPPGQGLMRAPSSRAHQLRDQPFDWACITGHGLIGLEP